MQPDALLLACERNIRQHGLISPGEHVLVGFSGGADSTALLDLLIRLSSKWNWRISVAHFHHGLREESDQEADMVKRWVRERYGNLPLFVVRLPVAERSAQEHISLEMAGREARYEALLEIARTEGCDAIALGHQRDDQVETVLWRFLKGTGPEGLAGIRWCRSLDEKKVIRPLLSVPKDTLRQYCRSNGLSYVEDRSNLDVDIPRNRVRHRLVPHLKEEYNPSLEDAIWRLSQILQDEQTWLEQMSHDYLLQWGIRNDTGILFDRDRMLEQPVALQRLLIRAAWRALGAAGPMTWRMVEAVRRLVVDGGENHAVDLPEGWRAMISGGQLKLTRRELEEVFSARFEYTLSIPGEIAIRESGCSVYARFPEGRPAESSVWRRSGTGSCIWVDSGKLRHRVFKVRNRRPGDRFWPLGMPSDMKLKDFLIKAKIPREKRDSLPLLFDGDRLVWILGVRLSEAYRLESPLRGDLLEIGFHRL